MMKEFKIDCGNMMFGENPESVEKYFHDAVIEQVMPIPQDMAVMLVETGKDGAPVCCDSRDTNWPTGLAVVQTNEGVDIVPIDLVSGELQLDAQLVNRHKCGKCGKEMKIHLKPGQDEFQAKYQCKECNRLIELNPDGTEEEVNE